MPARAGLLYAWRLPVMAGRRCPMPSGVQGKAAGLKCLSAIMQVTVMRVLGFCVGCQIQQLRERIDVRFAIHDDEALQAIRGIIRRGRNQ